ncbi:Rossmann-like fold-containing protein [Thalassotalea piscium]
MYINPAWRILTIGDGDLSFSLSLQNNYHPQSLTATIFDDYTTLKCKYGTTSFHQLQAQQCEVLTDFDVTNKQSWGRLSLHQFDAVFFQFPLLPAFNSMDDFQQQCKNISLNTLHRRLLRRYLINCFDYFLDTHGAQLAFITSKDVKPYRQWQIERSLTIKSDIHYLGSMAFEIEKFPGYKIRNVDRDKHVKDTQGITYVFSRNTNTELSNILTQPDYLTDDYCRYCRVGPFYTAQDKHNHIVSKKHQQMVIFEQQWLNDVDLFEK